LSVRPGHIDHGSLRWSALTGTHPDRRRKKSADGITIDLGFEVLEASGVRFGLVAVPGHERSSATCAGEREFDLVRWSSPPTNPSKRKARAFRYLRLSRGEARRRALTKSDSSMQTLPAWFASKWKNTCALFLEGATILP